MAVRPPRRIHPSGLRSAPALCLTGGVLRFEPVSDQNFGDLAQVIGASSANWRPSIDEVVDEWGSEPSHVQGIHLLAYENDVAVGYGGVSNPRHEFVPGRFNFQVRVTRDNRHRGLGQSIAANLDDWLADRHPEELVAQTDGQSEGERFTRARGFAELERRYEQRLTPSAFDTSPGAAACVAAAERCRVGGVRLVTLDALRAEGAADLERRLYELDTEVIADEPSQLGHDPMRFVDWCSEFLSSRDPSGVIIAMYAEELVGLTVHWTETEAILIATTGVVVRWRGRGVAKALKLASVEHSRRLGLPLRTMNNAANEPILRLNALCGFERVATYTRWRRRPAFR
jgi:GNAT superfamily N-acetyltransferase